LLPILHGISYDGYKELELIKQLFDIDKLFDESQDLNIVRQSFINIAKREIEYRKLTNTTVEDVLDDIFEFARIIILRGSYEKEKFNKISIGIQKLKNYIFEPKFLIDKEVLTCAAKLAYIVKLLKGNDTEIERYNGEMLDLVDIQDEYKKQINVIRKLNSEAYFYIIKAIKI